MFTSLQLDALKEFGNIGSGNSATSLSIMLNTAVNMEVTQADVLPVKACEELCGVSSGKMFQVIHSITGDIKGVFWLVMSEEDRSFISEVVAGDLDVEESLVIEEVSNILGASYLRPIADMMNVRADIDPPSIMSLSEHIKQTENLTLDNEHIIFILNKLEVMDREVKCYINMILDSESMTKLLAIFGL